MQLDDYLRNIKEITKKFIKENLGEPLDFDLINIPEEVGIFFIYIKKTNELQYIGATDRVNSTIKDVLSEYLNPEFTGIMFRNKIMQKVFDTFNWVENEIGEEIKNTEQINQTIKYIKENYLLRLIILPKNIALKDLAAIKEACISLELPILND